MNLIELGQIKDYELHSDINKYMSQEYDNIKIIKATNSIYYINSDFFRLELNKICPLKKAIEEKSICENVS